MESGVMPLDRSGVLDLWSQILCVLGILLVGFLLQWPELDERMRSTVSINKAEALGGGILERGSSDSSRSLSCRGGEGRWDGGAFSFFRLCLPRWWFFLNKCNQAGGLLASAILGRKGGLLSTTSRWEAHLRPGCWSSALRLPQVVRPRWIRGGQRRRICAGKGRSSILVLFLGGDAWRTPASGGGGIQGLDCFSSFCSQVFYVKRQALSSNIRFFRASVEKVLSAKCTCHIVP
ncbi:uncharacterized protein LOC124696841 [Lolium rigidum]|uniref:uncharacterized protein LOC124696841 n=1 Tax=Lolium rigidum TaxID=89674 RepID=UPI001F5C28AB|nr:uncharacterized protein LOC124696841 [Lolium rigidum]